jgi:hypothetical protein
MLTILGAAQRQNLIPVRRRWKVDLELVRLHTLEWQVCSCDTKQDWVGPTVHVGTVPFAGTVPIR